MIISNLSGFSEDTQRRYIQFLNRDIGLSSCNISVYIYPVELKVEININPENVPAPQEE